MLRALRVSVVSIGLQINHHEDTKSTETDIRTAVATRSNVRKAQDKAQLVPIVRLSRLRWCDTYSTMRAHEDLVKVTLSAPQIDPGRSDFE